MGRHKKPVEQAELDGSKDKNPGRYENNVPKPDGELGRPPPYLDRQQKACWREIAGQCHEGLLKNTDRHILEQAAILLADIRETIKHNRDIEKRRRELLKLHTFAEIMEMHEADILGPLLKPFAVRAADRAQYVQILARLGMSPVDRQKINLDNAPDEDEDEFAAL